MTAFYQDFNDFMSFVFNSLSQILNFFTSNLIGRLLLFVVFISLFFFLIERIRGE